ncbi:MAG TPA: hypothetical protein VN132_02315 [Bdellovibrio sp.]|nr:hypothetical protein [Bdellovibrio sp.]
MLKHKKSSHLKNQKGMAIFEMIPILIVIVLLVNFSLGFFGSVHTGILNSIASRNYAFGTFNHRADLTYFRNTRANQQADIHYEKKGMRLHGVCSENAGANNDRWIATARKIDFFDSNQRLDATGTSPGYHSQDVNTVLDSQRNERVGVNPVWIKTLYGICLRADCRHP